MRTRIPQEEDLRPGVSDYVVFVVAKIRMEVALAPDIAEKIAQLIDHELGREGAAEVSVGVREPVTGSFPLDSNGDPLAWPDPNQPEWYVDAWNGIYDSREFALAEVPSWVAREEDRKLAFGEPPSFDGE